MDIAFEYLVRDIVLQNGNSVSFSVTAKRPIAVTLRPLEDSEIKRGRITGDWVVARAAATYRTNERISRIFSVLATGCIPSDDKELSKLGAALKGRIPENYTIPSVNLPSYVTEFVDQARTELSEAIIRAVGTLRWRTGIQGGHNPFRGRFFGCKWSLDGERWHVFPGVSEIRFESAPQLELDVEIKETVESLLTAGIDEPTGHVLLREAWEIRRDHPRSAILIGFAALETGFKALVSDLTPTATWLMDNVPSPPVLSLIREYLPLLPVRCKLHEKVLLPPEQSLALLKKGIQIRNAVAHKGANVAGAALDELLLTVRDTLWLFDFARGHNWALQHLSPMTREALGLAQFGGVEDA